MLFHFVNESFPVGEIHSCFHVLVLFVTFIASQKEILNDSHFACESADSVCVFSQHFLDEETKSNKRFILKINSNVQKS